MRTDPDPQQLPCPQQRIEFLCQIMVPSLGLAWSLPTGGLLQFTGASDIGDTANLSDDTFVATLTDKVEDPNNNIFFFFTSILLVLEPVNGSNLTCREITGGDPMKNTTTIIISGK